MPEPEITTPPPAPSTPPPPPAPLPRGPEVFSREYVEELRHENASYRTRAQEAKRAAEQATEASAKAATEAEAKITAARQAANERIIRAELKAAAIKAGMVDLDGLKLADLSKVKLNDETGEVEGADDMMKAMKEAKPYLFGSTQNSSTPGAPPPAKPPVAKHARDMTPEERAEARKQFK